MLIAITASAVSGAVIAAKKTIKKAIPCTKCLKS